ncbi:MAG: alpha/beta fold hydrolase [Myxococcales bacterium]|nr:alpha/beta hydrolase [Polyangiaceae bacterium]MDW8247716.1 alpha/beta fold hydrolase [Myxococcales bacterium]
MADLAYISHGAGPCLLLLHAFPLDSRLWRAQLGALGATHRVIAPDLRGFGRSRGLGPPISIGQMADDVATLLDTLGIPQARVAGLSMGGYVALALLAKHPTKVERLILCDTRASSDTPEAKQGRARQLALLHGSGVAGLFDQLLPRLVGPLTGNAIREEIRQIALDQPVTSVSGAIVALRDRDDHAETLQACRIPVLGLVGTQDTLTPPEEIRAMMALTPLGVLEEIPHAGHLSCIENPDAFNRAVLRWLAEP